MAETQSPFRPSPFLSLSLAVHAAGAATLLAAPSTFPAVGTGLLLNHALIGAVGLCPRSRLLGPNIVRLRLRGEDDRSVALTFDDGPDPEVTPRVLDTLDAWGARATFFCIGRKVEAWPTLTAEIHARGHGLGNHTHRHPNTFALLGVRGITREIQRAQDALHIATGVRPLFFRAPVGFRNPFLEPALCRLGLRLVSWTRRGFDTMTRDPNTVARRLQRGLAPGDILLMHDGSSAQDGRGQPVVVEALQHLLASMEERGLRTVGLDRELM